MKHETYHAKFEEVSSRRVKLACKDWSEIYAAIQSGEIDKDDFEWLIDNYRDDCLSNYYQD